MSKIGCKLVNIGGCSCCWRYSRPWWGASCMGRAARSTSAASSRNLAHLIIVVIVVVVLVLVVVVVIVIVIVVFVFVFVVPLIVVGVANALFCKEV
jgi:hypothetical protein